MLIVLAASAASLAGKPESSPVYDIPLMKKVVVDGKADDWKDKGFRVELLAPVGAPMKNKDDHDARFRLGWHKKGLLVLVSVRDNTWLEHEDPGWLWKYDGVELFLAPHRNAEDLCQWVISPGMTQKQEALRTQFCEYRKDEELKKRSAEIEAARGITADGCLIEALLPWQSLAIEPGLGREVGFQIWANDVDTPDEERRRAAWYPGDTTQFDRKQMHRLRLARRPGKPILVTVRGRYAWPAKCAVAISAPAEKEGKRIALGVAGRIMAEGMLALVGSHARADIRLPISQIPTEGREVDIYLDGDKVDVAILPAEVIGDPLHLRLFDEAAARRRYPAELTPEILPSPEGKPNMVLVRTDGRKAEDVIEGATQVRVQALAPGGKAVAEAEVKRGETVPFDTTRWPDGPYEIRLSLTALEGHVVYQTLRWYKGSRSKEAGALLDWCDRLPKDSDRPEHLIYRLLEEMVLDRFGVDPRRDPSAEKNVESDDDLRRDVHLSLMEYLELRAGDSAVIRPHGFVRLAWKDEVDDSPQFARLFLPPEYDPGEQWPMVVMLHGYHPPNPRYSQWNWYMKRHNPLTERHNVIFLQPHGRGNAGYRGIGEKDVLTSVRLAQERLSVDTERIYLMGHSMGGYGTWYLGSRHPDVFAGLGPMCGAWDYRTKADEGELKALTRREHFERERSSTLAQLEALLTTPVFPSHGDVDQAIDVDHSRFAVRMLQRWGYDVRYMEVPGVGHTILGSEDRQISWFLRYRLNRNPTHVRVRSARLESARAHWVRVEQRRDPFDFIAVDARIVDRNAIRLDTDNVLHIRLSPGEALVDRDKPVRIVWNGKDAGTHRFVDGVLTLRAEGYLPGKRCKTPAVAGPIRDVTTTPFAIVVGTISTDPAMRRLVRHRAESRRQAWEEWQHVTPRYFSDAEITDEQIRKYSLLLFGGPEENLVTRKLSEHIPLSIRQERIIIDGQTFAAKNAGVAVVYPHPLNPARYVLVTAGTSARGMFLADEMPDDVDFAIVDGRIQKAGGKIAPEKLYVASGCFDYNWRHNDLYVVQGDPVVREEALVRKVPRHFSAGIPEQQLMLSNLLETRSSGSFRDMRRDVNWQRKPIVLGGRRYENGIAVLTWPGARNAVTYDLTGGNWRRLRAVIGYEVEEPESVKKPERQNTNLRFLVRGDGKELYRSPAFKWDAKPVEIDVDISQATLLELEVVNEVKLWTGISSANWADARLEK